MDGEGKSKEILMVDDGFFNLINSQNISNKIMDIVKKLENSIQKKSISMVDEGKSKEILMVDDGFFNLINRQNIFKNKKKPKKIVFSDN